LKININITSYIGYIVSELKKYTTINASLEALVTRIIKAVKRDIEQKKLGAINITDKNDDHFLTESEFIDLIDDSKYINNNEYYKSLLNIFFDEKRLFYIGIIFIILSLIIYFIDGATI
jgi:hypothetical protein